MQIMATLRCTLPPSTTERQSSSGSSPTISVPMWPTVTALMRAADNGHTGPARLLLAHGADCTIKNMASPHIRILLSTHSLLVSAPYKLLLFAMLGLGIVADFRVLAFFLSLWFNLIAEASIFQHAASSVVLTKLSVSLSDEIDRSVLLSFHAVAACVRLFFWGFSCSSLPCVFMSFGCFRVCLAESFRF
eukprot:m.117382 g.117382  ORF g.117382 m.117382 type:complete len:190 (+) comp51970_c0_seq6:122-691(+)